MQLNIHPLIVFESFLGLYSKKIQSIKKQLTTKRYRYDAHSMSFILIENNNIFDNGKFWQLLVLINIFLAFIFIWGDNFYKKHIAENNKDTFDIVQSLSSHVNNLENRINVLHEREQSLYTSVLNIKPLDVGVWEGGIGGTPKAKIHNLYLQNTVDKIHKIKYQIKIHGVTLHKLTKLSDLRREEISGFPILRPLNGPVISGFCYRGDPISGHYHFHQGLDMVSHYGAPIYASGDGEVIVSGWKESGYGIQVMLKHTKGYQTKYAHLSMSNVATGQKVKRGQIIGYVGTTGYSTGPHLHYEIIKDGTVVNPSEYLLIQG